MSGARHAVNLDASCDAETSRAERTCEWPGCLCGGDYRAPQSPQALNAYRWFCLDHVRMYNSAWNYYAGMSDTEVEADIRADTCWQRPSWPLGNNRSFNPRIRCLGEDLDDAAERSWQARMRPPTETERALTVLDLSPPITAAEVKARYKKLVKQHHPDANGGDKAAEERFKLISEAYRTVMNALT